MHYHDVVTVGGVECTALASLLASANARFYTPTILALLAV